MGYELTFWPTFNNNRGQLYRAFELLNTVDYLYIQVVFDCTILKLEGIVQAYPFADLKNCSETSGSRSGY